MNTINTIYNYLSSDFEFCWNLLAKQEEDVPRGNYFFALKSMIFLEFVSRICNECDGKLSEFSTNLDESYFIELPSCLRSSEEFSLPYLNNNKKNQYILYWLYKTIRHGTAHYYDQIILHGNDFYFDVAVTGPGHTYSLDFIKTNKQDSKHLKFKEIDDSNIFGELGLEETSKKLIRVFFNPGRFYLDIKESIENINLIAEFDNKPIDQILSGKYEKDMKINCNFSTLKSKINDFILP